MAKTKEGKKDKKDLGVTAEKDNFSEWFTELMLKADLADYSEVSGCMIFKPSSYEIWEKIKQLCDERFRKIGIRNCYFPLFIPEKLFEKEKEHIASFSPEVAWVTYGGSSKLKERLAIRPTSETIMYAAYAKWIRSWRDLPLRLNQWNNAVRWEFKHPVPFFRTREFLWNELHTVLASEEEALEEGKKLLKIYLDVCENFLALYGIVGKKTEQEKFGGAVASWKIHYILPNGKVIEGPCFHYDGQNFARAFGIKFLNKDGKQQYAYQNTYAISTRMLGAMFAIHADDKGLVLPPRLAPNKIVIVPIFFNEKEKEDVIKKAREIANMLVKFNAFVDLRDNTPGFKFNDWELKGVPLRIEIGPKDIKNNQVVVVRRDNGKKEQVKIFELVKKVTLLLNEIQKYLFERSKKMFKEKVVEVKSIDELVKVVKEKKVGIISLCRNPECEGKLKETTNGIKAVCIIEEKKITDERCLICKKKADYFVLAGKTY
ncbi:MAG: proline--tRNA ligase [Candidatus Pacearchaeota archaeon]